MPFSIQRIALVAAFTLTVSSAKAQSASWSSEPGIQPARQGLAATTVGDLALFAGGDDGTQRSVEVNIYDASTGSWNSAALSVGRDLLAATSVGTIALFAGGRLQDATGADTVLAGDMGCLLNIAGRLKRTGSKVEARHVAEVLAGTADSPAIAEPS